MITEKDFFGFPYFEYGEAFYGSNGDYRYRLAREPLENIHFTPVDKRGPATLRAVWWKGKFCYAKTPEEERVIKDFDFSEEGMKSAIRWLSDSCPDAGEAKNQE